MRVDRTGGVDEHQHLGVGQQRAGQRQALPLTARELPTALVHVRVEALGQRLQHVVGRRHAQRLEDVAVVDGPVPRVQLVTQRPGEQPRLRFGHEDAVAHRVQGQALERYVAERDAVVLDQPTQPVRDGRCLVGVAADQPGHQTRLDGEPRHRVREDRPHGRCRGGIVGLGDLRPGLEDADDPGRSDQRAGELVRGLDRRADRHDKEEGVAVERDDVAGRELALDGEPRAEPGQRDEEDARQQHLSRVQQRLQRRDTDSGVAQLVGAAPIARQERRLAADAAEHPQPSHGVRPERGQAAP